MFFCFFSSHPFTPPCTRLVPPAPSRCLSTLRQACLGARNVRKSILLPSSTPPPSFLPPHGSLPLLAVKCPFCIQQKLKHNIRPYRSRHKYPRAHSSSLSSGSSFNTTCVRQNPPTPPPPPLNAFVTINNTTATLSNNGIIQGPDRTCNYGTCYLLSARRIDSRYFQFHSFFLPSFNYANVFHLRDN